MPLYFGTNLAGDLLAGLMNINMSTESLGNPTLGFTGSVLGKDNPNMRITFFPLLLDPETQQPIPGDELIAFAAGSFNKKKYGDELCNPVSKSIYFPRIRGLHRQF